jgi:peptide/nickel transport system permease protein
MTKHVAIGLMLVLLLAIVVFFGGKLAPHDPNQVNMKDKLQPVSTQHIMGTDQLGRDMFSRILYATGISTKISLSVVGVSLLIGLVVGSTAGYFGGILDEILMRIVDLFMSFPSKLITIAIAGMLGPSLVNIFLAMAVTSWVSYARMIRGCVLSAKQQLSIEATRVLGAGNIYIIVKHILGNIIQPISSFALQRLVHTMLAIVALSFLGLGAQPPTAELGAMIKEANTFIAISPHLFIFPGLMVVFVVFSFNFLGDALRDMWDPRIKNEVIL